MTEPEMREEARAADDATISSAHRSTITVSNLTELVAATREIQLPFNHDTAWWRGHANAEWRLVCRRHFGGTLGAQKISCMTRLL